MAMDGTLALYPSVVPTPATAELRTYVQQMLAVSRCAAEYASIVCIEKIVGRDGG